MTPTASFATPDRPSLWASIGAHLRSRAALASCGRIALVVGTLLNAVNQIDAFVAGDYSGWIWVKAALNYIIPFCVSSAGYIAAARRAPRHPMDDG